MFLVLRCGQNCSILVWPPQRPCDLHLTKTKIYLPKLPSMLNLKSIRPLGAVLQHRLSEEPDFAIPLWYSPDPSLATFTLSIYNLPIFGISWFPLNEVFIHNSCRHIPSENHLFWIWFIASNPEACRTVTSRCIKIYYIHLFIKTCKNTKYWFSKLIFQSFFII